MVLGIILLSIVGFFVWFFWGGLAYGILEISFKKAMVLTTIIYIVVIGLICAFELGMSLIMGD